MRRPADSPTVALLVVVVLVYAVQVALGIAMGWTDAVALFALTQPITEHPWTVVTSIYAHWTLDHLLTNAIGLVIAGALVERNTTYGKFQAFVLLTGIAAALSELLVAVALGPHVPWITSNVAIMGISGSIMALIGYVLASNTVTATILGRVQLSRRTQIAIVVVVAAAITYLTTGPRVAVVAHFAGLVLGLVAGHQRILRA